MSDSEPFAGGTPYANGNGNGNGSAALLEAVYQSLRQLAHRKMMNERPGHTLQTTGLVHEAYLRLAREGHFEPANPGHFYKCAAEAMRRILIEHARKKQRIKHGGKLTRVPVYDVAERHKAEPIDLLALDRALSLLEIKDARKAEMVKLYYFAGFSVTEAAEILGVSTATAKRDLAFARAWMRARAGGDLP